MTMLGLRERLPGPARLLRVGCFWYARCGQYRAAATRADVALMRLVRVAEAANA